MATPTDGGVIEGDGYALAHIDALGDRYGFRSVRRKLGVTAFGVNAISMPPGYAAGPHYHEEQEELYFVYAGTLEMRFGDGSVHVLEPGTFVRVDPSTVRQLRNISDVDAIYLCVGGKGGYVGRDGHVPGIDDADTEGPPGAPQT